MTCDSTRGRELSVSGEACSGLHVISGCSIGMRLAALVWTCVEILPHGKIYHPELVVSWTSGLSLSHCGYHLTTSISFVPLWFSWMCLITSRVLRALYARYVAGLTTLLHTRSSISSSLAPLHLNRSADWPARTQLPQACCPSCRQLRSNCCSSSHNSSSRAAGERPRSRSRGRQCRSRGRQLVIRA